MRQRISSFYALALILTCVSPVFSQEARGATPAAPVLETPSVQAAPPAVNHATQRSLIVTPEYYIGPEDVLEVIVWRNADLSKTVTVRPDGRISLPLLGDIDATGMTPKELGTLIATRLKKYKETPETSVILQQVNSYAFYILGEVTKPGRYALKTKTTLVQAITNAGGFTSLAARNKIVIFRFQEGSEEEIKIKASYDDIILKEGVKNIVMRPGDTLIVPGENMVITQ